MRRVVIVGFEGMELLDVAGPSSVFSAATQLSPRHCGYTVELVAASAGPVRSAAGIQVSAGAASAVRGPLDTLLVVGGLPPAIAGARGLAPLIARLAGRSRRTASICTGAFLLAEAGLLRGRRVATHWSACEALRRAYPDSQVEPDPIFVRDGEVWTSAGVTSGLDLALALVESDLGSRVTLEIARWLVMYLRRPGGQSQFSAPLAAQRADHDAVGATAAWASEHLDARPSVEGLAARAGMSVRNFSRVFRHEIGLTPSAFLERLRLESARRSLELTRLGIKQIAEQSGFGTVETLHRAFQRRLRVTPGQYRARFARGRLRSG